LTLVTTEKDLVRVRKVGQAKAIVPFPVTLELGDAASFRKFIASRLFQAREKKFRTGD
jgi:tetraacyldisaccharide-1-P 4'-kinase